MSELASCRERLVKWCKGNVLDVGFGDALIVPNAICLDRPEGHPFRGPGPYQHPTHWTGDAMDLPFKDGVLDTCFCICAGMPVQTERGLVPVEYVAVGDKVLNANGNYVPVVKAASRHHSGDVVEIKPHRLPWTLRLTENHSVLVNRDGLEHFVNAGEITTDDWLISPSSSAVDDDVIEMSVRDLLPQNNPKYDAVMAMSGLPIDKISEITGVHRSTAWQYLTGRRTPSDCYVVNDGWVTSSIKVVGIKNEIPVDERLCRLIGYYVSDGCAAEPYPHSVCWYFNRSEQRYRDDVIEMVRELFGLEPVKEAYGEKGNIFHLRYCSKLLWLAFRKLGGGPRNKRIADWVMRLPPKLQRALLGGLFAGDGYVAKDGHRAGYTTASPTLAMQVRDLILRQGARCSLDITAMGKYRPMIRGREIRSGDSYCVRVHGAMVDEIAKWCGKKFAPLRRGRAKNNKEHFDNSAMAHGSLYVKPRTVTRAHYDGLVYDLTVDPTGEMPPIPGLRPIDSGETFSCCGIAVHNSSHCLEDQPDTRAALKEWLRVIKPGGHLVLFLPDQQRYVAYCLANNEVPNGAHKIPHFSLSYVKQCAEGLGVEIVHELDIVPGNPYSFDLVLRKL